MSYLEKSEIDNIIDNFVAICSDTDGWSEICTKRDVKVSEKYFEGNPCQVLKGEGVIAAHHKDVLALLKDFDRKGEWDLFFEKGHQIRQVDDFTGLGYFCTKSTYVTWARDFALLATGREIPESEGGGVLFVGKSFKDDSLVPEESGFVRGTIHVAGYKLVPAAENPDYTHITFIFQGWLPGTLVTQVNTYQPLAIVGMRKVLTGTTIHPPEAANAQS